VPAESCDNGEAGELVAVLGAGFAGSSSASSCSFSPKAVPFTALVTEPLVIDEDLGPGDGCAFAVTLGVVPDATEAELLQAQTDRVTWDIVLTLEDIGGPPGTTFPPP
jgi:hypothetical protein